MNKYLKLIVKNLGPYSLSKTAYLTVFVFLENV